MVIKEDLTKYPNKTLTNQKLPAASQAMMKAMAEKMLGKMEDNPNILNLLWTSDEAYFHLEGKDDSKNNVLVVRETYRKGCETSLLG